jgi:hypothetical protein
MSVDNTKQIGTLLTFRDNDFYFVQVIKRRKDNSGMERGEVIIKNYYITSMEQYEKLSPRIAQLCDMENARAYIRINSRNFKKLAHPMLKLMIEYIAGGQYKSLPDVFDKVTGRNHSDPDTRWVADIDWSEVLENNINLIDLKTLISTEIEKTGRDNTIEIIPTKNGCHFISRAFNLKTFKDKYPSIVVGKDTCTLMYCA